MSIDGRVAMATPEPIDVRGLARRYAKSTTLLAPPQCEVDGLPALDDLVNQVRRQQRTGQNARDIALRVAILYIGSNGMFACRHCYRLAYRCQREPADARPTRRAERIRECLQTPLAEVGIDRRQDLGTDRKRSCGGRHVWLLSRTVGHDGTGGGRHLDTPEPSMMAATEVSMSSKRYTESFKVEAVKQVTERGQGTGRGCPARDHDA